MLSDDVAAEEGAFPTLITRPDCWITKSSTERAVETEPLGPDTGQGGNEMLRLDRGTSRWSCLKAPPCSTTATFPRSGPPVPQGQAAKTGMRQRFPEIRGIEVGPTIPLAGERPAPHSARSRLRRGSSA